MRTVATFLAALVVGALSAATALVATYDALTGANRTIPYDHSKFLLDVVSSPRIVIDGGSSSMFGIVPAMIEEKFGVPVVDAADNASIPLTMKVHRIIHYARRGDIIVLPLEWVYYTRSEMPSDFIDKTPDEYASYYGSLPFLARLWFVIKYASLHNVSDAFRLYFKPSLQQDHAVNISAWLTKFPYGDRKDDMRRRSSVAGLDCADYLGSEGRIVEDMLWAARELRNLESRAGVRIIVTWPAVAGDGCYRDEKLQQAARDLFKQNSIRIVGDVADSSFLPSHMLDTYYHVDSAAAQIRTRRLIEHLSEVINLPLANGGSFQSTVTQGANAFKALQERLGKSATAASDKR